MWTLGELCMGRLNPASGSSWSGLVARLQLASSSECGLACLMAVSAVGAAEK